MLCTSAALAEGRGSTSDRDIQTVGEGRDRSSLAVGAEVREDLHRIARLGPFLGGVGILDGIGDPEPAAVVEGEVEGLVDVRLGGDELDLEAGRDVQCLLFLGGRAVGQRRDVLHRRGLLGKGRGRANGNHHEQEGRWPENRPTAHHCAPWVFIPEGWRTAGPRVGVGPGKEGHRRSFGVVEPDLAVSLARVLDG